MSGRNKRLTILMSALLTLTMFAGCGDSSDVGDSSAVTVAEQDSAGGDGTIVVIHTSGEELIERIEQLYPSYEKTGDGEGKIGDVAVKWVITPNQDNAYQLKIDSVLAEQETAGEEDTIDLFTLEADYAKKYATSGLLMTMDEIGISEEDMSKQYAYTKDIVKDNDGNVVASSWQATPGFFLYRRSIAKDVFGTDDPEEIQKHLASWEDMDQAAADLKEKGYYMFAGYNDAYYPFNAIKSIPWVDDELNIQIDSAMYQWTEQTKNYCENGYNHMQLEINDIVGDLCAEGKVFGAFAAPWYMDYIEFSCLEDADAPLELGNGSYADWAVCNGPVSYYWGGTWLAVPKGCNNVEEVRDIIYALTCDDKTMKQLVDENGEFVNNMDVMKATAESDYECAFLGGQNHIGLLMDTAESIDMKNITMYDQGVGDAYKAGMLDYYSGNATKEEALNAFYQQVVELYPELKTP